MLAALSGHVEVLEMLMGDKYKDKIDIYSCNDQYKHFTAIHYAIIRKQ